MPLLIDWTYFLPAALLLLLPGSLFQGKKLRLRSISRDWHGQWSRLVFQPHYFFDLVRAAAGSWLLLQSITAVPDAVRIAKHAPVLAQGVIIIFAVLLQTLPCREPDALHAPVAFVLGLVAGFTSPLVAAFALVISAVAVLAFRTPVALFIVLPVGLAVMTALFFGKKFPLHVAPLCVATFLPWLLSPLLRRELVVTHRMRRDEVEQANSPLR